MRLLTLHAYYPNPLRLPQCERVSPGGGRSQLQHQSSRGRATAAETVQALKASMAAVELGLK
jgi:hypothetical protein